MKKLILIQNRASLVLELFQNGFVYFSFCINRFFVLEQCYFLAWKGFSVVLYIPTFLYFRFFVKMGTYSEEKRDMDDSGCIQDCKFSILVLPISNISKDIHKKIWNMTIYNI